MMGRFIPADPELMTRMLIVGYCFGIRSERRLCDEAHLMWPVACSAGSTWPTRFPIIRPSRGAGTRCPAGDARIAESGRFRESGLFRRLFEDVLARCIA
jgi:hypothetical protein